MQIITVYCAILIVLLSAAIINGNEYRLPKSVLPTHYDVRLRTEAHTGAKEFQGSVVIAVDVLEPMRFVALHALGLDVRSVNLSDSSGGLVNVQRKEYLERLQQLRLTLRDEVSSGSYILRMEFVTTDSIGWIVKPYSDADGSQKYFLATQFEPTYARAAFPCFDEPGMKATFSLEVVHHESQSIDSNMPMIGTPEPLEGDYVVSRFEKTPKMSTYLLAFTVTEGYRTSGSGNHTTKARAAELEKTLYPLEVAKELLAVMDEYTGLPYQDYLPKLTHLEVPIPSNWWRAKENWGLIVYCEDSLLHDPKKDDLERQKITQLTIGHELAHMWFGNLVTHKWWDYVWLKEGFATLYMYYALHLARPSEQWMEWFNVEAIPKGLANRWNDDVITRQCEAHWEIRNNYRAAIFERAGSVLNMMRKIVGDSKWQQAVRSFLNNHQLGAVVPSDLYQELDKVTEGSDLFPNNTSLDSIMETWTKNTGVPMLSIQRNYYDSTVTVSQHQQEVGRHQLWTIPYNYAEESNPNFDDVNPIHWLVESSTVFPINASSTEWIIFSKRHFGLYRIKYDVQNWKLLVQALRSNISCLPRENRAQLLADAFYFFKKEELDKPTLFDLLTFLPNETESLVWYTALPILNLFKADLRSAKYQRHFITFLHHITARFYANTLSNPTPTSLYDASVRKDVTFLACQSGNPDCLRSAQTAFRAAYRANSTDLPPDDTINVFCFGMQQSDTTDEEFRWLLDQYDAAKGDERKQRQLMRSLGCAKRKEWLRALIEKVNRDGNGDSLCDGLSTDLSGEQVKSLVELMKDDGFTRELRIGVVVGLLYTMNKRKQSEEMQRTLLALKEQFRSKMREARIGYWNADYTKELEDPSKPLNKMLEEFVLLQ